MLNAGAHVCSSWTDCERHEYINTVYKTVGRKQNKKEKGEGMTKK
jgi:hypothetical protein